MKLFPLAVTHDNQRCDIAHVDVESFAGVPDALITKVHAVCLHDGRMLIVHHPKWNIWGLPGGTREPGEMPEETLGREIYEETNCRTLDCKPLCYQLVVCPSGEFHIRLNYLCRVEPIDHFQSDPAGNIDAIRWIHPQQHWEYLENKPFKTAVVERAIDILLQATT